MRNDGRIALSSLIDYDYNDSIINIEEYRPYAVGVKALRLSQNIIWIGKDDINDYEYDKGNRNAYLLTINDKTVVTGKYCAFVGNQKSTLTIRSRFAPANDFFLLYMLSKVYNIDSTTLLANNSDVSLFDLYELLLPSILLKAVGRGWYKEYERKAYNDSRVKGVIDVGRHIRANIPFQGKIAYNIREHSFDNRISQLIRHAVEVILSKPFGRLVMSQNEDFRRTVTALRNITPTYNKGQRMRVIYNGMRPISHPLYYDYEQLRRICIHILRQDKTSYTSANDNDEIYGIVIDIPYLWEEYLATLLKNCEHPSNREGTVRRHLDEEQMLERYPDFIKEGHIVIDAKYKLYEKVVNNREDLAQLISYMHCFDINKGMLIHPDKNISEAREKYTLKGLGGEVQIWSLGIPASTTDFTIFSQEMVKSETKLQEALNGFILQASESNKLLV